MNIQFFNRDRLMNNEYLLFNRDIEALVLKYKAEVLKVEIAFNYFQSALTTYDNSIVKVMSSTYTPQMAEAATRRRILYVGTINRILMAKEDLNLEVCQSAIALEPLAKSFQKGQNRRFTDLSGYIINLIQELQSDKNCTHIEKLGLTKYVEELDKINKLCISLSNERTDEYSERAALGKTIDTRPLLNKAYDELRELLNAQALINNTQVYSDLFREINARIDFYRIVISNHLGRGKGGKTGGGDSTPPYNEEERPGEL